MNSRSEDIKIGDLVLVQPMRYCYTFVSGSIQENLTRDDRRSVIYTVASNPTYTTNHWTGDGFKARVLDLLEVQTPLEGELIEEEYVQVKVFGQGRKHFVKHNSEKTKVVWIQKRLVSKCRDND